jgi:hypothetical protein
LYIIVIAVVNFSKTLGNNQIKRKCEIFGDVNDRPKGEMFFSDLKIIGRKLALLFKHLSRLFGFQFWGGNHLETFLKGSEIWEIRTISLTKYISSLAVNLTF